MPPRSAAGRKFAKNRHKEQNKHVHDAERALRKLEAATTVQELRDAIRRGARLQSYLPALEEALPGARKGEIETMAAEAVFLLSVTRTKPFTPGAVPTFRTQSGLTEISV